MNAYVTKFSSGTILALLAFSGLLVLVPLAAPTHAVSEAAPSMTFAPESLWYGGGSSDWIPFNFTNPATNPYAVTALSITAPAGWSFSDCDWDDSSVFDACTGSGVSSTFTLGSSGHGLLPGQTTTLWLYPLWATGTYPVSSGSFTTTFESNGAFSTGQSFTMWSFDPSASVTVTTSATLPFSAGSGSISVTGNIGVANAGVPVVFATSGGTGSFSGSGVTCHRAFWCWASTNSAGKATVTFSPSNTAGTDTIYGIIGGEAWDWTYPPTQYDWSSNTLSVTTVAGAPAKLAFLAAGAFATSAALHYETAFGMPSGVAHNEAESNPGGSSCVSDCVSFSIADKFGNPIPFAASSPGHATAMTITATSGNGIFDLGGGVNKTSVTCADFTCPTSGGSMVLPFPYFQSPTYGTQGIIAATATVDGTTLSGSSGSIQTSTFDTAANTPTDPDAGSMLAAGSTTKVTYTLTLHQANVPVALFAFNTTSPYVGSWAGSTNAFDAGAYNITSLTTSSAGSTNDKFSIDTTTGSAVDFEGAIFRPTDATPNHWVGPGAATSSVTTKAGPAAGFLVSTFFDSALSEATSNAFSGATIYVDVSLVDAFGNSAINTGVAQIQINLTPSAGTLSATSVYIASGADDTFGSFGPIQWTTAGTAPTTSTLKASGVVQGSPTSNTATLNIVSKAPTLTVTATTGTTVSSVIYSSVAAVGFNLKAKVSLGYDPALGVNFAAAAPAGVWYQVDSGAWALAASSATASISTGYTVIFTSGLHTVNFMANDSNGNNSPMVSFKVLVDAAAPDVNFGTANNANLSAPASVTATILDKEGDLNATSVSATGNSTKALTVAVSGTNNPGSSVSYSVTITGLTTGTWVVALSGTDLAGNSNSSSITVHVIVPYAQSLVISGTPTLGTLGGYSGINVAYQNLNPTSQNVVIFAVWKNSLGQTAGIGAGSATIGAGATTSAFIVEPVGLAAGTYSVNLFVFTTSNNPVSITTTISVTV